MHRKQLFAVLSVFLTLGLLTSAYGQDSGIPDTMRVGVVNVDAGDHFAVPITMYSDQLVQGVSAGFYWNDPDVFLDSVSWIGSNASHISAKYINIDQANFNVLLGIISVFEPPIQPGDSLMATMWFTADAGAEDQFIYIDSGFVPPAGAFKLNATDTEVGYPPQYMQGRIIIGEPQPPPEFILSDTEFGFSAFDGGSNPTPQVLEITNGGGQHLSWSASWNSSWLTVDPDTGTAPSNVQLLVDISGLGVGTYADTITLTDPNATNSPQEVVVNLEVIVPPPVIQLVPGSFQFTAQQDSINPDPKWLIVNDIGAGTLSWTASNSEPWLTLSDYSGGPGDSTQLMVDITGMMFGEYYDTVVVTDPAATNSPQVAPVKLTIVSGIPILEVSPDSFYCAASFGQNPYSRPVVISNVGGDYLQYTLESVRGLMTFDPDSGAVVSGETGYPTVHFLEDTTLSLGFHYDTLIVDSPNALEAPKRLPVTFWMMENPPELTVSPSSLVIESWECFNWPPLEPTGFEVFNAGGEDMYWTAVWDAPWLTIDPSNAPNDDTAYAIVDIDGLVLGTYIDTVIFNPIFSITPPETVEVVLNINEQTQTPELNVEQTHYEFIFQENQVGTAEQPLTIRNLVGGCMQWSVSESVSWLDVEPDTGTVPNSAFVGVNGFLLPPGKTTGSFLVLSPGAVNSPVEVTVDMYVWMFGDADCEGSINIDDIVYLVEYVFNNGPAPCPRSWVGDVNCSHGQVDVDDIVYLINYVFMGGPEPCTAKIGALAEDEIRPAVHTFQNEEVKPQESGK